MSADFFFCLLTHFSLLSVRGLSQLRTWMKCGSRVTKKLILNFKKQYIFKITKLRHSANLYCWICKVVKVWNWSLKMKYELPFKAHVELIRWIKSNCTFLALIHFSKNHIVTTMSQTKLKIHLNMSCSPQNQKRTKKAKWIKEFSPIDSFEKLFVCKCSRG